MLQRRDNESEIAKLKRLLAKAYPNIQDLKSLFGLKYCQRLNSHSNSDLQSVILSNQALNSINLELDLLLLSGMVKGVGKLNYFT